MRRRLEDTVNALFGWKGFEDPGFALDISCSAWKLGGKSKCRLPEKSGSDGRWSALDSPTAGALFPKRHFSKGSTSHQRRAAGFEAGDVREPRKPRGSRSQFSNDVCSFCFGRIGLHHQVKSGRNTVSNFLYIPFGNKKRGCQLFARLVLFGFRLGVIGSTA